VATFSFLLRIPAHLGFSRGDRTAAEEHENRQARHDGQGQRQIFSEGIEFPGLFTAAIGAKCIGPPNEPVAPLAGHLQSPRGTVLERL
jgi:hypothetical protein